MENGKKPKKKKPSKKQKIETKISNRIIHDTKKSYHFEWLVAVKRMHVDHWVFVLLSCAMCLYSHYLDTNKPVHFICIHKM